MYFIVEVSDGPTPIPVETPDAKTGGAPTGTSPSTLLPPWETETPRTSAPLHLYGGSRSAPTLLPWNRDPVSFVGTLGCPTNWKAPLSGPSGLSVPTECRSWTVQVRHLRRGGVSLVPRGPGPVLPCSVPGEQGGFSVLRRSCCSRPVFLSRLRLHGDQCLSYDTDVIPFIPVVYTNLGAFYYECCTDSDNLLRREVGREPLSSSHRSLGGRQGVLGPCPFLRGYAKDLLRSIVHFSRVPGRLGRVSGTLTCRRCLQGPSVAFCVSTALSHRSFGTPFRSLGCVSVSAHPRGALGPSHRGPAVGPTKSSWWRSPRLSSVCPGYSIIWILRNRSPEPPRDPSETKVVRAFYATLAVPLHSWLAPSESLTTLQ